MLALGVLLTACSAEQPGYRTEAGRADLALTIARNACESSYTLSQLRHSLSDVEIARASWTEAAFPERVWNTGDSGYPLYPEGSDENLVAQVSQGVSTILASQDTYSYLLNADEVIYRTEDIRPQVWTVYQLWGMREALHYTSGQNSEIPPWYEGNPDDWLHDWFMACHSLPS